MLISNMDIVFDTSSIAIREESESTAVEKSKPQIENGPHTPTYSEILTTRWYIPFILPQQGDSSK